MPRQPTRRDFLTVAGTGAAAAISGCSSGGSTGTSTTRSTGNTTETNETQGEKSYTGGTLNMASPGPVQTLDPVAAKGSGAGYNQYEETLMTFPNGDLPPVGQLAVDYSISKDGKTYTFELKKDVPYHPTDKLSGKDAIVTAEDVVFSWERIAQSKHSRNKDDIIGDTFTIAHEGKTDESLEKYKPWSAQMKAVDKYTFQFTLATPFHGAISQIAAGTFSVLPNRCVGDIVGRDGEPIDGIWDYNQFFGTAQNGPTFTATGPFKVDSWSKGDQIRLSRFKDYHGTGPYIDEIVYTVLGSANARYKRAINRNLDIFDIPTTKFNPDKVTINEEHGAYRTGTYGPLENGATVNYGEATALETEYILFNTNRTERPFRRAVAYMLNQHEITDRIFKGLGTPAYMITPSPVWPHRDGETPSEIYDRFAKNGFRSNDVPDNFGENGYPYGYDETRLDKARQVMEAAGYSEDNPYHATMTVFKGDRAWGSVAKLLRKKARSAHIRLDIQKASFGTIITKAINGDMDLFSLSDGLEWPEADNFLRFLHAGNPGTSFTRWGSEDRSEWNAYMRTADRAWQEKYVPNKGPGKQNQRMRNEAYITIEQMNWASVQELPLRHGISQRFWYDDINVRMHGPMENQTFNTLTIDRNGN